MYIQIVQDWSSATSPCLFIITHKVSLSFYKLVLNTLFIVNFFSCYIYSFYICKTGFLRIRNLREPLFDYHTFSKCSCYLSDYIFDIHVCIYIYLYTHIIHIYVYIYVYYFLCIVQYIYIYIYIYICIYIIYIYI